MLTCMIVISTIVTTNPIKKIHRLRNGSFLVLILKVLALKILHLYFYAVAANSSRVWIFNY